MDHSVRIGLELPPLPSGATAEQVAGWRALAVAAERAGFESVWVPAGGADPCTLGGGLVPLTSAVTLGIVCELVGDRHPAVLARDLTGLDVVSGGRSALLLSVRPDQAERVDEAVAICRALFAGEAPHLQGQHYSVDGAVNRPRPVRPGGPPVLVQGPRPGEGGQTVDGWVVTGSPEQVAASRAAIEGALVWRGPAPDGTLADRLHRAGVDGVIVRPGDAGEVGPLADLLLGRWST